MRQGAEGSWLFTLPYTSEPHSGALVFLYYLFLGHLSAWLRLPALVVYHAARSLAGIALLLVAYRFLAEFVTDVAARRLGFVLIALSSGLGWLLAPIGVVSPDLWVPEANTFYSIFTNPHFPLAEALMLVVCLAVAAPFDRTSEPDGGWGAGRTLLAAGGAVALAIVQPFSVLTAYGVLGVYLIACGVLARSWSRAVWGRALVSGLAAVPVVAYDVVIYNRGAFAAWSAQNQTPSPSVALLLATYGVLWVFALIGAVQAVRTGRGIFLVVWTAFTVASLYAPFALQRRLVTGLHLPVAILAVVGLTRVIWPRLGRRRAWATAATLVLAVPSTVVLLIVGVAGPARHEWPLFTTTDVWSAIAYLRENAPADVVLAAPETSLFIPAWAGSKVIYGHPFETIDAAQKRAAVEDALQGRSDVADLVRQYGVRYVFVGPLERAYGLIGGMSAAQLAVRWTAVYSNAEVTIYRVDPGG
jgi:hypothetical protein